MFSAPGAAQSIRAVYPLPGVTWTCWYKPAVQVPPSDQMRWAGAPGALPWSSRSKAGLPMVTQGSQPSGVDFPSPRSTKPSKLQLYVRLPACPHVSSAFTNSGSKLQTPTATSSQIHFDLTFHPYRLRSLRGRPLVSADYTRKTEKRQTITTWTKEPESWFPSGLFLSDSRGKPLAKSEVWYNWPRRRD
jgi:hypothetical protein